MDNALDVCQTYSLNWWIEEEVYRPCTWILATWKWELGLQIAQSAIWIEASTKGVVFID